MPDNYSIKEFIAHYMNDMKEVINEIHTDVKEIKAQTTRTNGRVSTLETRLEDYDDIKKVVRNHENYKWYIVGGALVLFGLGYLAIKTVVRDTVDVALKNYQGQVNINE